MLRYKTKLDLI